MRPGITLGPAVVVPGLVFASGQVGMGEIKAATRESLGNLKKVLELSGSSLDKVVKFNSELSPVVDRAMWDIPLILSLFEGHGGDGHHE